MQEVTVLEQELLDVLETIIGAKPFKSFDTSSVITWDRHTNNVRLSAAVDALLPNGRYKSGFQRGLLKDRPIRRLLESWAKRGLFTTGRLGYWFPPLWQKRSQTSMTDT
jgi:hypothetical protein